MYVNIYIYFCPDTINFNLALMKIAKFLVAVLFSVVFLSGKGNSITIEKGKFNSVGIIIPDTANSIILFAAQELKKHLDLVFDGNITIAKLSEKSKFKKQFYVGILPDGFHKKLNPEEAVYIIKGKSIYIFGDDAINKKNSIENPGDLKNKVLSEVLNISYNRTGTLFAVYNFLENELNIKWIKPGDDGIIYTKRNSISLTSKESAWTPQLIQRNIRTNLFKEDEQKLYGKYAPVEFHPTSDEVIAKQVDVLTWMRRMRMGRSKTFKFGHAYTNYWEKYKGTNPDIFALNGKGERKPLGRVERVKMCPTSPDLPKLIVDEWKINMQKDPFQNAYSISACENDGDGFGDDEWCHCAACMAIDDRHTGEDLTKYATDRYVHLWNAALKEARQYNKDIQISCYAYSNVLQPPRKEKLDDGIIVEFVPMMGGDFVKTKKLYDGWKNAGMTQMMYRPNDLWWEIGMPMGQEERVFDHYKLAIENNAMGTDFDALLGYWEGVSDMTYYILAKGHVDTKATFEQLENEYLSSFGGAKDDIANYYRHWRNIFNNKIMKEEARINDGINPYFLEYHRLYRLTERIGDFYSSKDFDTTDSLLANALKKDISEPVRNYIKRMQIVNAQSRLTFNSFIAGKSGDKDKIIEKANELVNFRFANKDKIDMNWSVLFQTQYYQMNDLIGTKYLDFLPKDIDAEDAE